MMTNSTAEFEVGANGFARWCFPVGMETGRLIDITTLADTWCKYIDESSGEVVDCADFAKAAGLS